MSDNRARHFHAGKLRKTIGDTVYVSVEAAKALGLTQQAICHALKGRTRLCGGFTWVYC